MMLEDLGHDVSVAVDGREAVELSAGDDFDLILMDVVMPGLNGFQATRQLTKDPATAGIPVIIVTTKDQQTDKVWGMRQGARDYLTKPVAEADLVGKIKTALGG